MQQLGFHSGVGAHGHRQVALRPGQTAGALDQFAAHGGKLLEAPQRRTLFGSMACFLMTQHLHFPVEIVRQHGRQQKSLVAGLGAGGDVIHLCLRLELGEYAFLGAAPIMKVSTFLADTALLVTITLKSYPYS